MPRRALTATAVATTMVVLAVFVSMWWRGRPLDVQYWLFLFHSGPPALLFVWVGRLVLLHRPGNAAGRVLLAAALLSATQTVAALVADVRLVAAGVTDLSERAAQLVPAELPISASVPMMVMNALWVPPLVLVVAVLPLVFPDGTLIGPRWQGGYVLAGAATTLLVASNAMDASPWATWTATGAPAIVQISQAAGALCLLAGAVLGFAAMVVRWRRAAPDQRYPFQMVALAASGMALTGVVTWPWPSVFTAATLASFHVLLAVYGLGVARYRLHDLEPFLGRAGLAVGLSAFVVVLYLGLVAGAAVLVSGRTPSVVVPLLVGIVGAAVAGPVSRRARWLADRVLLRRRVGRAEVVSRIAASTASAPGVPGALHDAVELLVRGTGAARAEAWLDVTGLVASAGSPRPRPTVLVAPIVHNNERLGELRLCAHASADLVPDAAAVLDDMSNVVGVVVRLQALSRRLVETHDAARREVERDLHDGVQAHLLSVRLRLGNLRSRSRELDTVIDEVDLTIDALRDLARGLYPPILERSGLLPAVTMHCEILAAPVTVVADRLGRYEPAAETAVYFACLEALQNAVRHARAGRVTVRLTGDHESVGFTVTDDGVGFDPALSRPGTGLRNIADRVAALGGRLEIDTAPGQGTRVAVTVPAQSSNLAR